MATLVRITNADGDEQMAFPVMLKSQIVALREELGKHTSASAVPHSIPNALSEKALGERNSHGKQASRENELTQIARGTGQLPLPTDASSTAFATPDEPIVPPTRMTPLWKEPRARDHVFTPRPNNSLSLQHAPPSAYPQVMPGSLPALGPDQAPVANANTRNPPPVDDRQLVGADVEPDLAIFTEQDVWYPA